MASNSNIAEIKTLTELIISISKQIDQDIKLTDNVFARFTQLKKQNKSLRELYDKITIITQSSSDYLTSELQQMIYTLYDFNNYIIDSHGKLMLENLKFASDQ